MIAGDFKRRLLRLKSFSLRADAAGRSFDHPELLRSGIIEQGVRGTLQLLQAVLPNRVSEPAKCHTGCDAHDRAEV
jgi:hypothetical protein